MYMTNFSTLMAFLLVLPLLAFVISPATSHDDQPSTRFRTTLTHVDHHLVGNTTKTELFLRAIKRGSHRVQQLNSRSTSIQTAIDEIRSGGEYLMNFSIGTPTPSPITAIIDTGSSLIWTQCQPCQACFNQSMPIFEPEKSHSYSRVKCSTKLPCNKLVPSECSPNGYCAYKNTYGDGSYTRGVLATDTFTFEETVKVPRILFGCGVVNRVSFDTASGILGLGPEKLSLVSQMKESRFSYCLPPFGSGRTGFLAIGSRATNPPGANVKTTPLIKNRASPSYYYLSLEGISIGKKRLSVNGSTFAIQNDGSGGMIVDCGTTITYLVKSAFNEVDKELTRQLGLNKSVWGYTIGLEVCYDITSVDFKCFEFPAMVFHFRNKVNLTLTRENYFYISDGGIGCLAMGSVGETEFSILGGFQQQNTLVVHDLAKGTLSFLPNYPKCSGN